MPPQVLHPAKNVMPQPSLSIVPLFVHVQEVESPIELCSMVIFEIVPQQLQLMAAGFGLETLLGAKPVSTLPMIAMFEYFLPSRLYPCQPFRCRYSIPLVAPDVHPP